MNVQTHLKAGDETRYWDVESGSFTEILSEGGVTTVTIIDPVNDQIIYYSEDYQHS